MSRLGNRARRSGATSLLVAAALLDDGEIVECAVAGRYDGEHAAVVLTGRRLLLVNQRAWSPSVEWLPLDSTLTVQGWQDARTASLRFIVDRSQHVLDQIVDKPLAVELAGRVRTRTSNS